MGSLLNKDDDPENFPLLLSGSMSDGQSAAKEVADDGLSYEYDIIYISKIEISDENGIEYVAEAPGYIRIFYDNNSYESHLPTGSLNNQTFIDGYQLKQQIHSIMKEQNLRSISSSSTSIDKANIFFQFSDPNPPIDCNILEKIELFRQNITNEQQQIGRRNIEQFSLYILDVFDKETKYFLCKLSKELFHIDLSNQHINKYHTKIKQLIHLYKTLYLSLAGIPMPSNLTHKLRLILNFYEQYRHLVDENALESQFEIFEMYNKRILTEDCDIVIGIKLKFWPQIIQTRMNYLKYNKSHIYNKIKNATVYAIPKWSKSTDSEAAPYEFRLSFSVFESILARSRYDIEKKLNNIARRIYYRYIKKQGNLFSFDFNYTKIV
ncbi:unnamed protein product [Didymodactylos carnosus]|uniref:Uncharacterized protein n=1 Tax=Didymodactylos carnosus TaxID=1234261 RepID=A0A8S2W425_9BILA|nr:unnamed protein product [Didymodactylos carnosus]CAF4413933.1 unnamed protein product [Didymodactylos carnosus]